MNICFLEGDMSRQGGTERMTAMLANAFNECHSVWVISLSFKEEKVFYELAENVKHIVLKDADGKLAILHQINEIRAFLKKNSVDWVINVDIGTSIYGIPAAWGTKARVITWEHSNYYNNWNSRVFPYFRRFAAKHSDAMVVLTERDKENYQKNIRTRKPIYTIPNPAEKHNFVYNADSKQILSAGLLVPIKGYDQAIQAAAKVLPKYPKWKWIICGEGPEREKMKKLIMKANLKEQILLPGVMSNMDEQYQQAAMYVMTSKMEGLPMVLLEAKSWGLPIVSFDIMTGQSDIVRDGVNGFLVEPDNVDELSEKIEQLICSSELRKQFSEQSQLDMEKFDASIIIEKWQEVIGV